MSTNYNTLVTNIKQILEDDSQEFSDYIPVAIKLATKRLTREIDGLVNDTSVVVSTASNSRFLTKPSNYLFAQNLIYNSPTGENIALVKQTKSFVETYWIYGNSSTTTANPKYYADYNNSQFSIAPTPTGTKGFTLFYAARPTPVSTASQTNVYTTELEDAYLYASVVEMARFARNNELLSYYEQAYVNSVVSYNNEKRRQRRDEGMAPMNPNPQQNTLKQEN